MFGVVADDTGRASALRSCNCRCLRWACARHDQRIGRDRHMRSDGDGGPAATAEIQNPEDITFDASGNAGIADDGNLRSAQGLGRLHHQPVYRLHRDVCVATGATMDRRSTDSSATPMGSPLIASGNVYIGDSVGQRDGADDVTSRRHLHLCRPVARRVTLGDNGPATSAELNDPWGVACGLLGGCLHSDADNNVVRKVNPAG